MKKAKYTSDVLFSIILFLFNSAMVMDAEKKVIYACTEDNTFTVQKYQRNDELKKWEFIEGLAQTGADDIEVMLQLKLGKEEKILFGEHFVIFIINQISLSSKESSKNVLKGTTLNGFVIWDFNEEDAISTEAIVLQLPHGTRNISTRMLQSNSIMLSAHRNYAIAGVR